MKNKKKTDKTPYKFYIELKWKTNPCQWKQRAKVKLSGKKEWFLEELEKIVDFELKTKSKEISPAWPVITGVLALAIEIINGQSVSGDIHLLIAFYALLGATIALAVLAYLRYLSYYRTQYIKYMLDLIKDNNRDNVSLPGILSQDKNRWKMELNRISLEGGEPEFDIRHWSEDHNETGAGIRLSKQEAAELCDLLKKELK